MMHQLRYFHCGRPIEAFISESPPFVSRVGDEFEIEETQYKVLRVVVRYPGEVAGFEHLGRTVDLRVHVFPIEPRMPTPDFGRYEPTGLPP